VALPIPTFADAVLADDPYRNGYGQRVLIPA
jgi:hypothetical protein